MAKKKQSSGCGCVGLLAAMFAILVLASLLSSLNSRTDTRRNTAPETTQQYPYQFVATKTESGGYQNVMDLYAYSGEFDIANLKTFCKERKANSTARAFYYAVIFDNAANATFPSSPFTAEYGLEEQAAKHIRAIYVYNRANGHSELTYYADNKWESRPSTVRI